MDRRELSDALKRYRAAVVCENGHVIAASGGERAQDSHCERCGAPAVTACSECQEPIRGLPIRASAPPRFCPNCGTPYVWTAARMQAIRDLAAEVEELSPEDRQVLTANINDVAADTPRTELAAIRVSKVLEKLSGPAAALHKLFVDVASETAAKIIKGGP